MEHSLLEATQNQSESFNSTMAVLSEDRVLLCNQTGDCCQISSNLLQFSPGSLHQTQGKVEDTVSSLTRQYLAEKDHHRVSTSVRKAEVQVSGGGRLYVEGRPLNIAKAHG